jgi:hypothetical protein
MVADLVHVVGKAGNIYCDYTGGAGILAEIIKIITIFIDINEEWN